MSVVGSHQANITVNHQDQVDTQPAIVTTPRPGHVIITQLANAGATSMTILSMSQVIPQQATAALGQSKGHAGLSRKPTVFNVSKLLLKAVCKSTKQAPKTFTYCQC